MKKTLAALAALGFAAWLGCGGATNTDLTSGDGTSDAGSSTDEAGSSGGSSGSDGADGGTEVTDVDAAVYDTPEVCTSGVKWTRGDHGSASMHPGGTCVDCHSKSDGPRLSVGGTVYPTAHEPDDCNGAATKGLKVVITDANAKVLTLTVNSAGNFYSSQAIATPFSAKVVDGSGNTRAMKATQKDGDCNSCHTDKGANDAPGRIMAP